MNGCLVPSPHVLDLLFREQFCCLLGRSPVEPADQILTVFPARKSAGPLLLCLKGECLLDCGPVILHVDVGLCHESCFMSMPLVDVVRRPSPFPEVCQSGCHGSFHVVPRVLLFVDLVAECEPSLFDVLDMVGRPMGNEGV